MKNNWVRLIAGVLVSVALVGAISLTGGMKKGSRTDGLLYEASGLHPDGQLLLVNGEAVTCEEYLYWLAYDCGAHQRRHLRRLCPDRYAGDGEAVQRGAGVGRGGRHHPDR